MPPFFRNQTLHSSGAQKVGFALLFGDHIHIWQENVGQVEDAVDPAAHNISCTKPWGRARQRPPLTRPV
jgi:hypothetical protein